jgi:hypothetical protein
MREGDFVRVFIDVFMVVEAWSVLSVRAPESTGLVWSVPAYSRKKKSSRVLGAPLRETVAVMGPAPPALLIAR